MAETFLLVQEPMTGFTLDTTYGYLATLTNPSFSLVSGKTYLVIWDDLERPYTVTAYDATIPGIGSFVAIGNGTALGYQGNNVLTASGKDISAIIRDAAEEWVLGWRGRG